MSLAIPKTSRDVLHNKDGKPFNQVESMDLKGDTSSVKPEDIKFYAVIDTGNREQQEFLLADDQNNYSVVRANGGGYDIGELDKYSDESNPKLQSLGPALYEKFCSFVHNLGFTTMFNKSKIEIFAPAKS
jgi:hypothetical protein